MRALVYRGHKEIEVETVPDAVLPSPDGALVRVTQFAICGSDLHLYHAPTSEDQLGKAMGHECIGEVVETGPDVQRIKVGDRVLVSAAIGCGNCASCRAGLVARCERGETRVFGGSGLDGGQAEAIGVPGADHALLPIPDGISDEQAVLLTDILPTGYKGARSAEIRPGDSVAVIGCGPVGQMALETAFLFGPAQVFAIDQVPHRLEEAQRLGAIPIDASQVDPVEAVRDATAGLGPLRVIEAAGPDATVQMAFDMVRQGGVVSQVGVNQNPALPVNMFALFGKDVTYRIGLVSPQSLWPELVPLLREGRIAPQRVFTHHRSMSEGPDAYEVFNDRSDGVIKVMLDPSA